MESERKIEKWLRAYAKKRKGQAGDSFKLDSATRRILQNEISRNAPSPDEDDETMSLWELLRRHWMFFLGFAACIFVLASFYLQSVKTANSGLLSKLSVNKGEHSLGMAHQHLAKRAAQVTNSPALALSGNIQTSPPAAGGGRSNPAPAPNPAKIVAAPETPPTVLSQNITGSYPSTNLIVAKSMPPSQPTVAVAENAPASAAEEASPAPQAPSAPPEAQAPPPPATGTATQIPAAGGVYAVTPTPPSGVPENSEANGEHKIAAAPVSSAAAQNMFMNGAAAPGQSGQSATVLMNFRVVQTGSHIRVIDQDGSVYRGMLRAEELGANTYGISPTESVPAATDNAGTSALSTPTKKVESPRLAESDNVAPSQPPTVEKRHWWHWHLHWPSWSFGVGATAASMPAASESAYPPGPPIADNSAEPSSVVYSFRVTGMNQTLNQPVTFTATLIQYVNAMKPGQTNQIGQLPWSSLRIAGMAVVNRTNQIDINATPIAPAKGNQPPN